MKAYELTFPETRDESPYDVMGPLTARLATIRTLGGQPHVITGNSDITVTAVSNPITGAVSGFMQGNDVWRRLLFIVIGIIVLAIALIRLTRG